VQTEIWPLAQFVACVWFPRAGLVDLLSRMVVVIDFYFGVDEEIVVQLVPVHLI
jgi:hypothetical protein